MLMKGVSVCEDEQTDDDSLKSLFEAFGTITSVCAMKAHIGNKNRHIGMGVLRVVAMSLWTTNSLV